WSLVGSAASAAGMAFGGWALARELSPDDEIGAFLSMGAALGASLASGDTSVLFVITTLMLVRIVNRTVGLPARVTDSIAVLLLTAWCTVSTGSVLPAVLASLAFGLDATLAPALRRQWMFAAISMMIVVFYLATHRPWLVDSFTFNPILGWAELIIGVGFAAVILKTNGFISLSDATKRPLESARIKAGTALGLIAATGGVLVVSHTANLALPLWGILLGVMLGRVLVARTVTREVTWDQR
ncbi:MAG: hypothetical protein ABI679_15490, partial [Gemmatimonadota bacterium]